MATDDVVTVLTNPAYVATQYLNPRRKKRGKRKGRGRRHNPVSYEYMNPSYDNPSNPDMMDTFLNGSALTQDIGAADVVTAGASLVLNQWLVKTLKLPGWPGVIGSFVVPFVTGSLAGMVNERIGTFTFLGGQVDAFLKLAGKISPVGFKESGEDWVLTSPTAILALPNGNASARQLGGGYGNVSQMASRRSVSMM